MAPPLPTPSRTHAVRACRQCRQSKVRCLLSERGESSQCQRCERKGWDCTVDTEPDKRRTRKDTQGHVSALESQIAFLQARLQALECEGSVSPTAAGSESADRGGQQSSRLYSEGPEADVVGPRPPPVGRLILDHNGEFRWHNETDAFGSLPVELPALPTLMAAFLPVPLEDELHAAIVNAAFEWHFSAFRLVEQLPFMTGLAEGHRSCTYSPFLHLAILAIGCRYMDNVPPLLCSTPDDPASRGEPFADAALELLPSEIATPTFSTIRGLMSLAIFYAGTLKPHQGWIYAGLAYRICDDFALNIATDDPGVVIQSRRQQLFWTCFTDDVNWSLCIGRPCHFDLYAVHQPELPLFHPGCQPGTGAAWPHETRLQPVAWRIFRFNYPQRDLSQDEQRCIEVVRGLWDDLEACYSAVPTPLRAQSLTYLTPDVFELEVLHHLLVILLLKPFYGCSVAELNVLAQEQCTASASKMAALMQLYQAGPGLRFASGNVYHAIFHGGAMSAQVAARAPNWSVMSEALDNVNICVGALVEHAKTWPSASLVASALAGVRDTLLAQRAIQSSAPGPFGQAPGGEPGGAQVLRDDTLLHGLGEDTLALSPWDDLEFARHHGIEAYLGADWNISECAPLAGL